MTGPTGSTGATGPTPSWVGFRANKSADVSYTGTAPVKMTMPNEVFDTGGCYDPSTSRFQPTTAGKYLVYVQAYFLQGAGTTAYAQPLIMKNGASTVAGSEANGFFYDSMGTGPFGATSSIIDMNGSTDYLECWFASGANGNIKGNTHQTFWYASRQGP